jgi:hypothetical protein
MAGSAATMALMSSAMLSRSAASPAADQVRARNQPQVRAGSRHRCAALATRPRRHMQAVLKAQINKTDRNDARGIAQMMRAGLYRPVHVKTIRSW